MDGELRKYLKLHRTQYERAKRGEATALEHFTSRKIASAISRKVAPLQCRGDQVRKSDAWDEITRVLGTSRTTMRSRRAKAKNPAAKPPEFDVHDNPSDAELEGHS